MALAALFGRRKTPEEMLRQNQRALNKVRETVYISSHGERLGVWLRTSHSVLFLFISVVIHPLLPSLLHVLHQQVIRELDRERTGLERQEKKLVVDIKKMAKSGQMEAVKIMAKDLVRTRNFVKKFILMRANIQAIALKVQTLKSQAAMANAMKGWLHVLI